MIRGLVASAALFAFGGLLYLGGAVLWHSAPRWYRVTLASKSDVCVQATSWAVVPVTVPEEYCAQPSACVAFRIEDRQVALMCGVGAVIEDKDCGGGK